MRKRSTALLAGLLLAVCIGSIAVGTETWTKTYGDGLDDMAYDALLLDDGGYLVVGESVVEYEPQLITHLRLLRLDASGEVVWERTGVGDRLGSGSSVVAVDDGYVIAGTVQSDDGDDAELLLLKVDAGGNDIWWNRFGTPLNEHGGRLIRTEDGGYVILGNRVDPNDIVTDPGTAGYAGFAGRSNVYVVKADAEGREVWTHCFETADNVISSGGAIADDGGIIVLAYVLHFPLDDNDVLLFKLDADGDLVWSRTWAEGRASGYGLIPTSDGGFLICGLRSFPEDPGRAKSEALLIKVDQDGNELWLLTYGAADTVDTAHVATETADGAYVCAGWLERDLYQYTDNLLLASVDPDGTLLWEDVTEMNVHVTFGEILAHPDGSYVIVGSAARPGRPFRVQVIKIDPDGT